MLAFYCDHFVLPLPAGHRFPMAKYQLLRDWIQVNLPSVVLCEPAAATPGQLALAHTPSYVAAIESGEVTPEILRAIGFPWSLAMAERARRSVGATIAACRAALQDGVAANLAGGTHHAYAAAGQGFCVFNDAAVAGRLMQAEQKVRRVAVIDLDVHQGNGTAHILQNDPTIFTLSVHGENNFPFRKELSDLDYALPDGAADEAYLDCVQIALSELAKRFSPDLVIYLAGADPHEDDRLGKLKITMTGLAERDRLVFDWAQARGTPIAVVMAGGYGRNLENTVQIHAQTIELAAHRQSAWHVA